MKRTALFLALLLCLPAFAEECPILPMAEVVKLAPDQLKTYSLEQKLCQQGQELEILQKRVTWLENELIRSNQSKTTPQPARIKCEHTNELFGNSSDKCYAF